MAKTAMGAPEPRRPWGKGKPKTMNQKNKVVPDRAFHPKRKLGYSLPDFGQQYDNRNTSFGEYY